jgi:hypothetical protein
MQAPIAKTDNLQYIVDSIYKELTELKTEIKNISSNITSNKTFEVVKYGNNDYRIVVASVDGKVISPAFTLKED